MAQPYTLSFGSWSPDLQNVGVQLGFQYSATPVPCSDVLNVYYADGAFRSMPAPAAIGPSLGIPITNATNWYDDSTGKEEIFAATANGIYVLVDGTWTAVPVQTNSQYNAIGQVITFALGTLTYNHISASISPSSFSSTGAATTQTTNNITVSYTGNGSSYTVAWSLPGLPPEFALTQPTQVTTAILASGMSGGNTYTSTAEVVVTDNNGLSATITGIPISVTCTAPSSYSGTLVAGDFIAGSDEWIGYSAAGYASPPGTLGSLSPATDLNGHAIKQLFWWTTTPPGVLLTLTGFGSDPGSNYFTTLDIAGTPYSASSAVYSYGAGTAQWQWTGSPPFTGGSSYPIGITY